MEELDSLAGRDRKQWKSSQDLLGEIAKQWKSTIDLRGEIANNGTAQRTARRARTTFRPIARWCSEVLNDDPEVDINQVVLVGIDFEEEELRWSPLGDHGGVFADSTVHKCGGLAQSAYIIVIPVNKLTM